MLNPPQVLTFVRASTNIQVVNVRSECGTLYKVVTNDGAFLHPYSYSSLETLALSI
jgi:hypothetical protein